MTDTPPPTPPPRRQVAIEDQPFWAAIDAGRLVLARCACGAHYARAQACLRCAAGATSLQWRPACGRGVVRSFVIFERAYHPFFAGQVPYVVAVVALEEGPELITNLVDVAVTEAAIGMRVRLQIVTCGGQNIHQASARL